MDADSNRSRRLEKIKRLKSYLEQVDERLKYLVGELGWNYNSLNNENHSEMVNCPVDPSHRMPSFSLERHLKSCSWRSQGYLDHDIPLPDGSNSVSHITITPELQANIIAKAAQTSDNFELRNTSYLRPVPQTSNRLQQDFSRDERLAIYNHVVANTDLHQSLEDVPFIDLEKKKEKKEMTLLELAAAERDAKRRRASYRNKVHTAGRTQTDLLRQVIESQMESLMEEAKKVEVPEKEKVQKRFESDRISENRIDKGRSFHENPYRDEKSSKSYHRSSSKHHRDESSSKHYDDGRRLREHYSHHESLHSHIDKEGHSHHKKRKKEKHKKKGKDEKSRHNKRSSRSKSRSRSKQKKRKRSKSRSRSHDRHKKCK